MFSGPLNTTDLVMPSSSVMVCLYQPEWVGVLGGLLCSDVNVTTEVRNEWASEFSCTGVTCQASTVDLRSTSLDVWGGGVCGLSTGATQS